MINEDKLIEEFFKSYFIILIIPIEKEKKT